VNGGEHKQINFEIKSHLDLGQKLNLFDFERAAKISALAFLSIQVKEQSWNVH